MYVKVTTSGPRRYVQLIESFRDDDGRVNKRTVATLGRADQLSGELDSVIDGLLKVAGRAPAKLVPAIGSMPFSVELDVTGTDELVRRPAALPAA